MKPSVKRALPLLVLALLLMLTVPLTGCSRVVGVLGRAVSKVEQSLRDRLSSAGVVTSETPSMTATPEPSDSGSASPSAGETASPVDASQIPLSDIFAAPEYTDPELSGDGRSVLYRHIKPDGSADDVIVKNVSTGMETVVPYPDGTNGIPYFTWSGDSRHVLYMIDDSGDENFGLYSVDITTGKSVTIMSRKDVDSVFLCNDKIDTDGVYFKSNARDSRYFDLYWGDVKTGKTKLVMENPGDISAWYFDHQGNLRIIETTDDNGGEHLLLMKDEASHSTKYAAADWEEILKWGYGDTENSQFMDFTVDGGRIFYADSTGRNTAALVEMDLITRKTKVIDSDPDSDVTSCWLDLQQDKVTAVQYYKDRSQWKALDSALGQKFDHLGQIAKGDFDFASSSEDDRYWLIAFDNDTDGRSYYVVDSQTGNYKYLFHETPTLQQYDFAQMEPMSYTTSDGLTVHGYVTFPLNTERKNLPMVLLVHGGPQARDTWGFNSEVQWLANRGYMVLQVNFRGSTGYGKAFTQAGYKEWGGKMQQDLTEAVQWAVSQGYADRSRVAIMGGSYGGYAALAGAAFTPNVYACAVDMFGPSSLITLIKSSPSYWAPYLNQLYRSIGNPNTEADFLKSRSPLYSADKIKIPVLIAQGGNDVRVTKQEAEQMVQAMKASKLSVQYLYYPNAGHGFNSTEDYIDFYTNAEKFLKQNLSGK